MAKKNHFLKKCNLFIGLTVFTPMVWAVDLLGAWQAALAYDASYSAAQYDRDANQEVATQARSVLLPQLTAMGTGRYSQNHQPTSDTNRSVTWALEANQVLWDYSKWAQYQQGKLTATAADYQLSLKAQDLILNVSEAYFNILHQQDLQQANVATLKSLQGQLDQAKTMFQVGTASIIDTREAESALQAAKVKELDIINQLNIAQERFTLLTGLDSRDIQPLQARRLEKAEVNELTFWLEQAQKDNTEIKLKQLLIAQAEAKIKENQGNRLPTVSLQGGYQNQYQHGNQAFGDLGRNKGSYAQVTLSIPLVSGGAINSKIRQSKLEALKSQDELLATQRDIALKTKASYFNLKTNQQQIIALEALLKTNQAKLDATRLGQEVGERSNLDVVLATQDVYEAKQQLAKARYDYIQARLALLQNSGRLQNIAELEQINRFIAPKL